MDMKWMINGYVKKDIKWISNGCVKKDIKWISNGYFKKDDKRIRPMRVIHLVSFFFSSDVITTLVRATNFILSHKVNKFKFNKFNTLKRYMQCK